MHSSSFQPITPLLQGGLLVKFLLISEVRVDVRAKLFSRVNLTKQEN